MGTQHGVYLHASCSMTLHRMKTLKSFDMVCIAIVYACALEVSARAIYYLHGIPKLKNCNILGRNIFAPGSPPRLQALLQLKAHPISAPINRDVPRNNRFLHIHFFNRSHAIFSELQFIPIQRSARVVSWSSCTDPGRETHPIGPPPQQLLKPHYHFVTTKQP